MSVLQFQHLEKTEGKKKQTFLKVCYVPTCYSISFSLNKNPVKLSILKSQFIAENTELHRAPRNGDMPKFIQPILSQAVT